VIRGYIVSTEGGGAKAMAKRRHRIWRWNS